MSEFLDNTITDEARILIEMLFKPSPSGTKLRPEETQLLLSMFSEILKEAAIEEQRMIEEQNSVKNNEENIPCK
jgi:hypothetical protein